MSQTQSSWCWRVTPSLWWWDLVACSVLNAKLHLPAVPLTQKCAFSGGHLHLLPQIHLQAPSAEDSSPHQWAYWTDAEPTLDCSHVAQIWSIWNTGASSTLKISQRQADLKAAAAIRAVVSPLRFSGQDQTPVHSSLSLSHTWVRHQSSMSHNTWRHTSKPSESASFTKLGLK